MRRAKGAIPQYLITPFNDRTQRSRIMESNFFPSYVDRAMERLARTLREEGSVAVSKAKLQTDKNK